MANSLVDHPHRQRARVGLCWVAIPGLVACVGTKLLRTYDTVDELTFYASYHSHPMNQLVHIVCVPLLLFTVLIFAAYVPPPIKAIPQLTWPLLGACAQPILAAPARRPARPADVRGRGAGTSFGRVQRGAV